MKVVASYNEKLVAEIVVSPNVAVVAGRIFRYELGEEDGSIFTAHNGDRIYVRKVDGRLLVTGWKSVGGDEAALMTGTDGSNVYRSDGKSVSFHKLAVRIEEAAYLP